MCRENGKFIVNFDKNKQKPQKVFDTCTYTRYNDKTNKPLLDTRCGICTIFRRELASMKSTGIIRKVDELGRIVLPIEIRRTLDIAERDELEIYMESDRIILQKFEPACIFCGSSRNLIAYRRKNVCQSCVNKMSEY